jgi:hypothetical protein
MKPIICTILAGNFLLAAVALHDYLTPVCGTFGVGANPLLYTIQKGDFYVWGQNADGVMRFEFDRQGRPVSREVIEYPSVQQQQPKTVDLDSLKPSASAQ